MAENTKTIPEALHERIIQTADEYHFIAEDQWSQAIELQPESEDASFEFRRLVRAALMFYFRALLMLDMIETDEEQQFEELMEIGSESMPELEEFIRANNVYSILDEESDSHLSNVFAVAEALRALVLQRSTQLAASLGSRF